MKTKRKGKRQRKRKRNRCGGDDNLDNACEEEHEDEKVGEEEE